MCQWSLSIAIVGLPPIGSIARFTIVNPFEQSLLQRFGRGAVSARIIIETDHDHPASSLIEHITGERTHIVQTSRLEMQAPRKFAAETMGERPIVTRNG